MKKAGLSEFELGVLDEELYAQIHKQRDKKDTFTGLMKPYAPPQWPVFPIDGYVSWQERWRMGTGVNPRDET